MPNQLPYEIVRPTAAWAERLASFDEQLFGVDAWSIHSWCGELARGDVSYLVFVAPPRPLQSVGSILAVGGFNHGPDAEIATIGVASHARRRGLGKTMLGLLLEEAREKGSENMFLEVRANDAGAQQLYRNAGFVELGRRKKYYSDDDALIMGRVL
ncbi:MAG: GNAT family N-acetyltransferase [Actinomycetaceae bacterium]|nr:GNAT family N-acetyltransferase [Actinomycetaceae bacterium]